MNSIMKRFIALMMSLLVIFSLAVVSHAESIPGDINSDGVVNSNDALLVLQYSIGIKKTINTFAADINQDGKINAADALEILKISTNQRTAKISDTFRKIADNIGASLNIVFDKDTESYTVKSSKGIDTGLLGYKYSVKDKIFYTAEDSWQRNFGFSELYDKAAATAVMSYNTMRVKFPYKDKDWMIQFWKGQYGFAFIGAEIGVYTRDIGSNSGTYYECANDEQKLFMTMDVYRQNPDNPADYKKLFTRSRSETWWCTGFVLGSLGAGQYNVPDSGTAKLKVDTKIEFKDNAMALAFIDGLNNVTAMENNALLKGSTRPIVFVSYGTEEEYDASTEDCKYVLCEDAQSVRVTYR